MPDLPIVTRSPNLFVQGLILVLVPVLFQIVFVVLLTGLLKEAEHEVLEENRAKIAIASAHDLLHRFYQSGTALNLYRYTSDPEALSRHRQNEKGISAELASIEKLVRGHSAEMSSFRDLSKATDDASRILDQSFGMIEAGQANRMRYLGPEITECLRHLLNEVDHFVALLESGSARAPEEQARSRQAVVSFLYIGSLANLAMGLALVLYFSGGTVRRLKVLVENTGRLSRNETLLERVLGGDEIAHLDGVFHDMADSLSRAARHKRELMQMVSHDLKTPLSSVQIALSSLSDGIYGDLPGAALKEVRISEYNTNRLIYMIRDLLDIERIEAGRLELKRSSFAIAEFFRDAAMIVGAFAERRRIEIKHQETAASLDADRDRLMQVMVNLLSNAVKFSPKESTVVVEAEETMEWTEIRVIDQGPGVPAASLESIFERFSQLDGQSDEENDNEKGTGLGLSIARAIVEAHGGSIGVRNNDSDRGSTFWFRI